MEVSASRYRSLPKGFLPAENKKLMTESNTQTTQQPQSQQSSSSQAAQQDSSNTLVFKVKGKDKMLHHQVPSQPQVVQQQAQQQASPSQPPKNAQGFRSMSVNVFDKIKYADTL